MENNRQHLPPPVICPNCGLRYDPRRTECPRCSAFNPYQPPQKPEFPPPAPKRNPLLIPLILVSALAILFCVLWLTNRPSDSNSNLESKTKSVQELIASNKEETTPKDKTQSTIKRTQSNMIKAQNKSLERRIGDVYLTDKEINELVDRYANTKITKTLDDIEEAQEKANKLIEGVREGMAYIKTEKQILARGDADDSSRLISELMRGINKTLDYLDKQVEAVALRAVMFFGEYKDIVERVGQYTFKERIFQTELITLVERLSRIVNDTEFAEEENNEVTIKLAEDVLELMGRVDRYHWEIQELPRKYNTN